MANKHLSHRKSNAKVNTYVSKTDSSVIITESAYQSLTTAQKANYKLRVVPKLPAAGDIVYGELAVNYADGAETIALKNDANEIIDFASKEYVSGLVPTPSDADSDKFLKGDGSWATPIATVDNKAVTLGWNQSKTVATIDGTDITVKLPANPDTNTATLKVGDTANKRISTSETTGNYIQFTGGTNKFTVGDGTNSFDVGVTPSITRNVTGAAAWSAADVITVTNAASGNVIKSSGKTITTTVPSSESADTTVPTSKAVWSAIADGIATADAMVYKGTVDGGSTGEYGALTPAASKGWTYKVTTAGKIDGKAVEVGDILICNADETAAATSSNYATIAANWDFIQANIDGAVTGPASSTDAHVATFNGTSGKSIKDSGFTIGKSVPSNAVFTDASVTAVGNHYTPSADAGAEKTATIEGTAGAYALNTEYTVLTGVKAQMDAKGHVTGITYTAQNVKDTHATVNNGTFTVKTKVNSTTTNVADFTANQSGTDDVTLIQGDNVTLTPNATNRTITIAATDTTYSDATQSVHGLMSTADKIKLDGIAEGATANIGTITGITMNGSSKGTSGVVDLGTVITDVSDKADKSATVSTVTYDTTNKKITKTINGTTTDVVTASKIVTDGGGIKTHQTIKQDGITGATVNRFGTCSATATTAAKTVSVTSGTFSLETGASVRVKFANANTADNPTLNVGSTGAKNIFHNGAQITTGNNKALLAGVCDFVYDGTQYHLVGNYIDTNTQTVTSVVGQTGDVTASQVGTALTNAGYKLTDDNTASLKVSDTTNKKISTTETSSKYIQFTGGANKFTVTDGTNSFDVGVTPSIANNVTGSGLTNNAIVLGSGSSGVKTSSKTISTTAPSSSSADTTVPTSKAVWTAISDATAGLTGAMHFIGVSTTAITDGGTETPTIEGYTGDAKVAGNVVLYGGQEFIWAGTAWELLGDEGSYALKTIKVEGTGALSGGGTLESNRTITHNTSGVTAATYGPGADVTGTEGATIKVPQITVNEYGHITGVTERTYTSKNTTYTVGTKALKVASNSGTATQAIGVNENSSDRTLTISGDGTYISGTVSGSANAATVTLSHSDPVEVAAEAISSTATSTGSYAKDTEYSVVTGITLNRDAKGHVTGITTTNQKIKDTNTTYTVNNGTFTVKSKSGSTTTNVADFTANQSGTDDVTFIQGDNVTLTPNATNRTITIAATDTTYSDATQSAHGLMSAADKTKLDGIAEGATANVGTITGITMNGASKGTSGNVDLGTVITAHATHKLNATNGTASAVSQGTEITYVESVAGTTTATSGDLSVSTTRKKIIVPANTDRYVNTATFADDTTATAASPVKMTLTRAGSDSATVTANIPKVSSSSAGVAPKGAAVSTQSQSTKFLREDGTWAAPSYTTNTNTTYTFANGTNGFTVTPSGGSAQTVTVTPSISKNVTGAAAWSAANVITVTNAASGNVIKSSGVTISTTAPSSSSDDTTVPTSKAVWDAIENGIAEADAMIYKGTIAGGSTGAYGALTPAADKGWTYKVSTAGKIDGKAVEVGDMLICNADGTAAATSSNYSTIAANWDVIQMNIDGAVTGPASSTANHIAVFDGTTGKVIKDGTYTIGKSVPSNAVFTDTTYTFGNGTSSTGAGTFTVTPAGGSAQTVTVYNVQTKVGALGSSTEPLYTSAAGTFAKASKYAGGTAVTLNGTSAAASTASFYAPTSAGTSGQVLTSAGSGAPGWKTGEIIHVTTNNTGTGGSTASGSYNRTQWAGDADGVTALYTGLTVTYKIPVAGVTRGDTLNINNLGEHPVVINANSIATTHYPVGAMCILTYDADQKASVYVNNTNTEFTGCWKIANYDSGNTDTKVTQTVTTTDAAYEVLFSGSANNTTATEGARKNNNLTFNPSTGNLGVTQINGVTVGSSPKFTDTTYESKAAASGGTDVSLVTTGEKYTWNGKQNQVAKLGSTTKPVYTSAAGTFAECSTYAGGTAVTLNGTSKAASTASFYAPTAVGTSGQFLKSNGSGAPSWVDNPNTDTKVTSVTNHYAPDADADAEKTAAIDGTAGTYAIDTEYTLLTGVKAQMDAKGHVTGLTYTAQKIKDTDTTYTFANGTSTTGAGTFTVTPKGGTAQTVTVYNVQTKVGKLGGATQPVYTSAAGTFATCSTYAGGTKVTLNGTDKGATTATIYAPTSAGTEGQYLVANASGVPTWTSNPNTDTKVTQTATSTNATYEVLFSESANNTTTTEGARKNSNLTFNPSTGNLTVTQINGVTVGNSPKFTDNNTTYTFANGTSTTGAGTFTVTPSGGSAQTVTVYGVQGQVAKLGSTTKPVYTSAAGTFAECSSYAGGTAVTLNGSSKAASTASFYAPTSAGTQGQFLAANASGVPTWVDNPNTNTATLQVGDTANNKINTSETTGSYIQFTGGTNKFTVTDGTNSFDVAVTPSIANNVTGSGLTNNAIVLGSGSSGVKTSSKTITTTAPSSNSDDTTIPTSKAVWTAVTNGISTADAMVYKGTIAGGSTGSYGALTAAASKGWTYKVTTAGKIDGVAVEVGDMLICNTDGTAAATSSNYATIAANWDFIQTNIDGAVTGPASSTDAHVATFNGTTGKVIKDSGYTIGKSVPSNAAFTDRYVNTAAFADDTSSNASNPVKMTLTRAGSDTAAVTANIPKVSSTSAGVVPKGAAVSSQSTSTKFLREDGTWAAPSYPTYCANLTLATSANYITQPEFKSVKVNGSSTNAASTDNCELQYDTTNKCLKFIFN